MLSCPIVGVAAGRRQLGGGVNVVISRAATTVPIWGAMHLGLRLALILPCNRCKSCRNRWYPGIQDVLSDFTSYEEEVELDTLHSQLCVFLWAIFKMENSGYRYNTNASYTALHSYMLSCCNYIVFAFSRASITTTRNGQYPVTIPGFVVDTVCI